MSKKTVKVLKIWIPGRLIVGGILTLLFSVSVLSLLWTVEGSGGDDVRTGKRPRAEACVPAPPNMTQWWPGEGNANDIQGPTFENGTLMNGTTFAPGKVGQAFSFDGVDDYVNIPDSPALDLTQISISFWFKLNATGRIHELVNKFGPQGSNTIAYGSEIGPDNIGYFRISTNGGLSGLTDLPTTTAFAAGVWYHFAGTYDGSQMKVYVNGINEGTIAKTGDIFVNSESLMLGSYGYHPWFLNGMLDEVVIADRAFTAQEIMNIYNAGSAGICSNCTPPPAQMVSWWTGDNDPDDIIGNNDGTLVGGAGYATGKVGSAFSFNGANQYVEIPDSPALRPVNSVTLDGWFNFNSSDPQAALISKPYNSGFSNAYVMWVQGGTLYGAFGGGALVSYPFSPTPGRWYHIAFTADQATAQNRLFIDGIVVASSIAASNISYDSAPLLIGIDKDNGSPVLALDGMADEAELFSRALDPAEILAIYNAGSAGKCKSCRELPTNTAAWWRGEDNAGDVIGSNNGTLMNGAGFGSGAVRRAFVLDGADDVVKVPDAPALNFAPTDPMTIYMWVNPASNSVSHLIGKRATCFDSGQSANYQIGYDPTLGIQFNSGAQVFNSGQLLTVGQWQHIAVTSDGSTFRVFYNGAEAGSMAGTHGANNNGAPVIIGGACDGVGATFPGRLDEVTIVRRAMPPAEIQAIYNAGSLGVCVPQAANATISGRVMTPEGAGLRNATVTLTDGSGTTRAVTTSSFGYYAFEEVAPGRTYTVGVRSRRYRFTPRPINVTGNVTNFDFVGQE